MRHDSLLSVHDSNLEYGASVSLHVEWIQTLSFRVTDFDAPLINTGT
jgi:hypothetical protein